jgi:CheY-like chemotaxis protein
LTSFSQIARLSANCAEAVLREKIVSVIVIAEDHLPTQLALRTLIRIAGHDGVGANNGQEALRFIQANPVDLLLLDLMMPVMSGIELLKILRRDRRFARMPVVVYSASDEATHRDEAMAAGATDYFVKSHIDWNILGDKLASYLNGGE